MLVYSQSMSSTVIRVVGLPDDGVTLDLVGPQQVRITNHSKHDILTLNLFWVFKDGRKYDDGLINWHERRDPVLRTEKSLIKGAQDYESEFAGAQVVSVELDGVVFSNGKAAGSRAAEIKAFLDGKWRAERDIVVEFHRIATSQLAYRANQILESEAWRDDPDQHYRTYAQAFIRELTNVAGKRGFQAAIDCASERIKEMTQTNREIIP
jgi:nuclear transport factor 2 (NTF2) superfamily protein